MNDKDRYIDHLLSVIVDLQSRAERNEPLVVTLRKLAMTVKDSGEKLNEFSNRIQKIRDDLNAKNIN